MRDALSRREPAPYRFESSLVSWNRLTSPALMSAYSKASAAALRSTASPSLPRLVAPLLLGPLLVLLLLPLVFVWEVEALSMLVTILVLFFLPTAVLAGSEAIS